MKTLEVIFLIDTARVISSAQTAATSRRTADVPAPAVLGGSSTGKREQGNSQRDSVQAKMADSTAKHELYLPKRSSTYLHDLRIPQRLPFNALKRHPLNA